ncbi:PilZ domain-containing protein, partial [bacterium]|nr:PilZ domain-containing protein [bacterium]
MGKIVEINQVLSIIPANFRNSNRGTAVELGDDSFTMELKFNPTGILPKASAEFYSKTPNGMLYFEAVIESVEGNIVKVKMPIKHRYLKRRQFTRVKYREVLTCINGGDEHSVMALDLSAGGMKFESKEALDIEKIYKIDIPLSNQIVINSEFQPIRIEKGDDGYYTLSGRFQNQSSVDRMYLVQFCINKNIEN